MLQQGTFFGSRPQSDVAVKAGADFVIEGKLKLTLGETPQFLVQAQEETQWELSLGGLFGDLAEITSLSLFPVLRGRDGDLRRR